MNPPPSPPGPDRMAVPAGHYCEIRGCGRWGAFGFAHNKVMRWYCADHREFGAALLAPPDGQAGPASKPGQGSLF